MSASGLSSGDDEYTMLDSINEESKMEDDQTSIHELSHAVLRNTQVIKKTDSNLGSAAHRLKNLGNKKKSEYLESFEYMKSVLPTFSGNVNDYMVNYLLEKDIMRRMTTTKSGKLRLGLSPKRDISKSNITINFGDVDSPYLHDLYPYL